MGCTALACRTGRAPVTLAAQRTLVDAAVVERLNGTQQAPHSFASGTTATSSSRCLAMFSAKQVAMYDAGNEGDSIYL